MNLAISVENSIDVKGNPKFSKKSFSGVKDTAAPADVLAVGNSISAVLENESNGCYLTETSLIVTEE
ncbi:MAG TPA: hypothetical protein DG753_05685 [Clostridium sp.]|nr:hypothetical protein [Clostridium sp.]